MCALTRRACDYCGHSTIQHVLATKSGVASAFSFLADADASDKCLNCDSATKSIKTLDYCQNNWLRHSHYGAAFFKLVKVVVINSTKRHGYYLVGVTYKAY